MQKAKLFGIIGSGILCFGNLPTFTIYVTFFGFILIGVSLKMLSKIRNGKFFDYFLIASLLKVIAAFLFYFKIFAIITSIVIALMSNSPAPFTFSIALYFLAYYVLVLISSYFFYKSFYEIFLKFNNEFFRYGGLMIVLGAILTIFTVGFIFEIIGWLLILFGFFTLKDEIIVEIEIEKIEKKS